MAQKRNPGHWLEDRWQNKDGSPKASSGQGKRWRARYVDMDSREHAKSFRTKAEGQQWLNSVVAAQETGSYIDPRRGRITFNSYYAEWSKRQIWESGTLKGMNLAAGSVTFGDVAFADLKPSHIEVWVKWMKDKPLAASTIKTRFNNVRSVIRAAVDDRFLARDVCARVSLPRTQPASEKMAIPTPEEVGKLLEAAEPGKSPGVVEFRGPGTTVAGVSLTLLGWAIA